MLCPLVSRIPLVIATVSGVQECVHVTSGAGLGVHLAVVPGPCLRVLRLCSLYQDALEAPAPPPAGQRVARGVTWLRRSETAASTEDGEAVRAQALRAALSALGGAGPAGPRAEERGRRAPRHRPRLRGAQAPGISDLSPRDATPDIPNRPRRKVSPYFAPPLPSWPRPRPAPRLLSTPFPL